MVAAEQRGEATPSGEEATSQPLDSRHHETEKSHLNV